MAGYLYGTDGTGAGRRPSWIARGYRAVAAAAAEVRAELSRPALNRRVLLQLSALSERELKDIGLTRQDVADAAGPGHADAAHLLLSRREERRRARAAGMVGAGRGLGTAG